MRDVAGEVASVTGGASGIGLAMARSFPAAGMKVVIADIEEQALEHSGIDFLTHPRLAALGLTITRRLV